MGIIKAIQNMFKVERDVFRCAHCKTTSNGSRCTNAVCADKPPRGWRIDEHGGVCKPTIVEPPKRRNNL